MSPFMRKPALCIYENKGSDHHATDHAGLCFRVMRKPMLWFPTWSDTNQAVQLQIIARGLKFRIWIKEGLYYPHSENKDADQLRGYREADLRLCFRICKICGCTARWSD